MGVTRGLTDKPVTKEVVYDSDGRVVAAHLSTVVTDPTAANAVQIPDADQYPSANATQQDPLEVHEASSPADAQDPDEGTGTNEVQTLSASGTVSGGTFKATWDGEQTASVAYNATAAQFQTALLALPNLSAGDVTVTGGPLPAAVVTFKGNYASQDVSAITIDNTAITGGGTIVVAETTKGVRADAP
jgi:hypothetical protein